MCGFAGFYSNNFSYASAKQTIDKMLDAIVHRGPDDSGFLIDGPLTLGHRRLSIHDLSPAGHQPMVSSSKRYSLVFNGEIYNFENIRELLPRQEWRGSSDTEVMLAAFEQWGVEKAVEHFNGMFAFAVWDHQEEVLVLGRDRFGEKPLYYYNQNMCFAFGSELTTLESMETLSLSVNRNALRAQAERSYIGTPNTIYNEVSKLPPGHLLYFKPNGEVRLHRYWSLAGAIERSKSNLITCESEAVELLEQELLNAVKMRMAADVPLGAFLSGGVDSSLVVALMQSQSSKPVNTFSIGFNVPGYNEAEYAKEVSSYLGTTHHETYFSPEDVLAIVPKLGSIFDEPFSDASQLPTYLVSTMAREKVTVCLSGDGGDELFSGYKRYTSTLEIWNLISKVPFRGGVGKLLKSIPTSVLDRALFFLNARALKYGRAGRIGPKVKTLGDWMSAKDIEDFYRLSMQHWKDSDSLVLNAGSVDSDKWYDSCASISDMSELMMYLDTVNYLPEDILTKVDRTSMAVSLEGRIPLLDHNVAELAWRLPLGMKQKGSCGKWALKQVLYKYLPQTMMERPKMGFGVPIHLWLQSELKEWAQDLLSYNRLKEQGLYNPDVVEKTLNNHLSGAENNAAALWDLLLVQAWLEHNDSRRGRL